MSRNVSIVTGAELLERNMEHIVFHIGSLLSDVHSVQIVGARNVSERLDNKFSIISRSEKWHWWNLIPVIGWRVAVLIESNRKTDLPVIVALSAIGINGLAAVLASKVIGCESVVRLNSDVFNVYKAEPGIKRKIRMFIRNNVLGRMALHFSTKVVVLHEEQKQQILKRISNTKEVFVIPPPLGLPSLDKIEDISKMQLKISGDAFVVGSVGRLDHGKCPGVMLEVINSVLKCDPKSYFLIVGDGDYKLWLQERIIELDRVRFVGQIDRDDLPAYYRLMDVMIHTSLSEGFGMVIAEALSLNVPVVAMNSGAGPRSLTSNIVVGATEMVQMIVNKNYATDMVPDTMLPDENRSAWLSLIDGKN